MTSVKPIEMLTGKIFALGIAGLLQTVVWTGSGYLMLLFSNNQFGLGDAFKLPPSVLIWGIIYFLLGYAVYASLMAGVGALVPNLREASQLTTVVIMPMIVPMVFISVMINAPNSPLAVALSLFPLTAPVSMMTRLAATTVPFWQSRVGSGIAGAHGGVPGAGVGQVLQGTEPAFGAVSECSVVFQGAGREIE